ncbi:hypothetical protein BDA99DRAFT_561357 [Phascolomyces articulosus]|uniref:HMG box domain-containing protein n=1 Tax=Phascolomyces articulosus TaxID=60185 RepID=A0AAD5PCF2_9FUNG|nr:hypothetical protein BDA99DRAFT_561357 [Phascolomyces articulosus]
MSCHSSGLWRILSHKQNTATIAVLHNAVKQLNEVRSLIELAAKNCNTTLEELETSIAKPTPTVTKKRKHQQEPKSSIKAPGNGYSFYVKEQYHCVKHQVGGNSRKVISHLAKQWRTMLWDEKKPYEEMSQDAWELYNLRLKKKYDINEDDSEIEQKEESYVKSIMKKPRALSSSSSMMGVHPPKASVDIPYFYNDDEEDELSELSMEDELHEDEYDSDVIYCGSSTPHVTHPQKGDNILHQNKDFPNKKIR